MNTLAHHHLLELPTPRRHEVRDAVSLWFALLSPLIGVIVGFVGMLIVGRLTG